MALGIIISRCHIKYGLILKHNTMSSLLYLIAVILVIGWILGFFVYSAGNLIHILLVLAIVAVLLNFIRGRSV
ncbi:hypothetical protein C3K47_09390 [Solitalea longa]|uniref:Lmo0937 family membrane protein n=2 Tax=Solitalea longa TaxID=2079460 RepID=A0A2S5A2P3_9SPHI|nr:hypothetical protein C3K47_09390 [Solitalea longa]